MDGFTQFCGGAVTERTVTSVSICFSKLTVVLFRGNADAFSALVFRLRLNPRSSFF